MIQSTIPLVYEPNSQDRAIIKRVYKSFTFDVIGTNNICEYDDYAVLDNGALLFIKNFKYPMSAENTQALFEMLKQPILTTDQIREKVKYLVIIGGLYKTQTGLNKDLTTDYGGQPENWEITIEK